jgi:hypothetical protein
MKKTLTPSRIFILILVSLLFNLQMQAGDLWPRKSSGISLSYTTMGGFNTIPLNVEFLWHGNKFHHGIRTGLLGVFLDVYRGAQAGPMLGYTFMTGKGKNHFELMAGVVYLPVWLYGEDRFTGDDEKLVPLAQVGYRYQKPDGRMFFRAYLGIGGIGVGAGLRLGEM